MSTAKPQPDECQYPGTFGNYCHRRGIPEQGGLCFWHSHLPKTKEQVEDEVQRGRPLEGVVLKGVDLTGANLRGAWMRAFSAFYCSFDQCDFGKSERGGATWMQMAVFNGCNFINANLHKVNAELAKFTNCVFWKANLSEANLKGADLSNSSFREANFRGAILGHPGVILYPGIGNPEQYYTRIEGADFLGADFRDVDLDPMYLSAPNLQSPLRELWLDQIRIRLENAMKRPMTNDEKKKSLEILAGAILERIPGLTVKSIDKRRSTSEIDLIIQNKSTVLATAGLSGPIFVECRNVERPLSAKMIRDFGGKLTPHVIGIVITTNRLSSDAKGEIAKYHQKDIRILFWEHPQLKQIADGELAPEDAIIESYYRTLEL